ncbi:TPA: cell division protein FtsL [Candidatus Poribacteria bacterium]|nr:cell division protein FtsL [Candidatus Poribacteria bacterium]
MANWRKIFAIISIVFVIISLLFLRVWIMSNAVQIACEINSLDQKKEALEEENKKMMIELATLKSPERINKVAIDDLNMVRSSDSKIIFLER